MEIILGQKQVVCYYISISSGVSSKMRRGNEPKIMCGDDGKVIALFLSSDFCSEHEWGIKDILRDFGIKSEGIGIDRRRATVVNDTNFHFFEKKGFSLLLGIGGWRGEEIKRGHDGMVKNHMAIDFKPNEIARRFELSLDNWRSSGEVDIAAAWSDSDFGVMVPARNAHHLREVVEAFRNGDGAIFLGGRTLPVFDNGGLVLAIVSRIPANILEQMRATDEDHASLAAASDATGIIERIKKHNEGKGYGDPTRCGYYACKPDWNKGTKNSAYDVIYFLNPQQQDRTNFGWFTVEDLDQWLLGKGPIPMTEKQRADRRK